MSGFVSRLPVSIRELLSLDLRSHKLGPAYVALEVVRTTVFTLFLLQWIRRGFLQVRGYGVGGTLYALYAELRRRACTVFLAFPPVKSRVKAEVSEALTKLENKLVSAPVGMNWNKSLPAQGLSTDEVYKQLDQLAGMDHTRWEDGRVTGAVYHGGDELIQLQAEAFKKFSVSNPIHPDVFPGVRKMEAEVVSMVLRMFNAPKDGAGVTTSGGTESILMACYGARQKACSERGVTSPEMIIPDTAHAAFIKAGEYFKIKVHIVPCPGPSFQVDTWRVSRLINSNTVLLVGSAPNFPHGIIDNISELSRLAAKSRIPLHVDCCLGSFLVPCLELAGFETEPFDFRLDGVTSISCDTHKYGFGPKGSSTLLYRNSELRAHQYFITAEWSGGVYGSPSMAGSRPGALIAGCWASMMALGEAGYVDACRTIVGTAKRFELAIREDEVLSAELEVVGRPLVSVVAFKARKASGVDIYDLSDVLSSGGWHLSTLQAPAAIHIAFTLPTAKAADRLVEDLREAVKRLREEAASQRLKVKSGDDKPTRPKGDSSALYGVAGSLPDKSIVKDLARGFLDTLYKV